jgi:hypothetical protein
MIELLKKRSIANSNDRVVIITPRIIEQIKRLKSFRSNESEYCPGGLMIQWRYEDNSEFLSESDFDSLFMPMQFICMIGNMSNEFKNIHKVEYHHESLLRRLYLEIDDKIISTGFKRPFGNSNVRGDVAEEMKAAYLLEKNSEYYPADQGSYRYNIDGIDYNTESIDKEYYKFIDILESYMKDFQMEWRSFDGEKAWISHGNGFNWSDYKKFNWTEYLQPGFGNHRLHSYMCNWKLSQSELRDKKIDKILK